MTPKMPPLAVALGDQLHAEITERGNADAVALCVENDYRPDEEQTMLIEIGVQAGVHAALRALHERGWITVTL